MFVLPMISLLKVYNVSTVFVWNMCSLIVVYRVCFTNVKSNLGLLFVFFL